LAYLDAETLEETCQLDEEYKAFSPEESSELRERLMQIRNRGYEYIVGESTDGVCDVVVLVGTPTSYIRAALAICTHSHKHESFLDTTLPALRRCADAIGQAAGIAL
jgi:DNA-binding IclR family transcriptional regulator